MMVLPKHRPPRGHLHHEPLQDRRAICPIIGHEATGLVRKIDEDCAGLEDGERATARPVLIDNNRHFAVRIDAKKLRLELIAPPNVHDLLAGTHVQLPQAILVTQNVAPPTPPNSAPCPLPATL